MPTPRLSTATLPPAYQDVLYEARVTTNTPAMVRFEITAGALPEGLTLNPDTGGIIGTPVRSQKARFTITARNAAGLPDPHTEYEITVRHRLPDPIPHLGLTAPAGWQVQAASPTVFDEVDASELVVSAAGGAYLDQKYTSATPIGLTWACSGTCDFQLYYSWDPTTTVSAGIPEAAVLGVDGPLWSETVRGGDQATFLTLPRAAAILETGWTPAARKDVADFGRRLGLLGPHLSASGASFYESPGTTWSAAVAGIDVVARPGVTAAYGVGVVAAPGTKASADGTQIAADTVTSDGDPASKSELAEPLRATLRCDDRVLPVTFRQAQARDALHGAGVYTAVVDAAFAEDTDCVLPPSVGEPAAIRVRATDRAPLPGDPVIPGPAAVRCNDGRFERTGVIPATTYDGRRTISAVQGARSASTVVEASSTSPP